MSESERNQDFQEFMDSPEPDSGLTRRQIVMLALSAVSLAVTTAIAFTREEQSTPEDIAAPPAPPVDNGPDYEALRAELAALEHDHVEYLLPATLHRLDEEYERLAKAGTWRRSADKLIRSRDYPTRKRYPHFKEGFRAALGRHNGKYLADQIVASIGQRQSKRDPLYDAAQEAQARYIATEKAARRLVQIPEDGLMEPIFCEQVGRETGQTENDPEMCYLQRDLLLVVGSLIKAVNHQIDTLNAAPQSYGLAENFPHIPHITGIKASGLLRTVEQTKEMLNGAERKLTTSYPTEHWLGWAIDLGSSAPVNGEAHMVRFADHVYMEKDSDEIAIPIGGKLSTNPKAFGATLRPLMSDLIGRAAFAMQEPLEAMGYKLMIRWEKAAVNWHIALAPLDWDNYRPMK